MAAAAVVVAVGDDDGGGDDPLSTLGPPGTCYVAQAGTGPLYMVGQHSPTYLFDRTLLCSPGWPGACFSD